MKGYASLQFPKNIQISKSIKTLPVAAELFHADWRTDKTKLTVAFGNSANASVLCSFTTHCSLRLIVRSWVRSSNFRHQAYPRVSPRESTQRRKVELCARNFREFCLNADFHVTFMDILHAVKVRHGTDGFTSPPKEGVLRIFSS